MFTLATVWVLDQRKQECRQGVELGCWVSDRGERKLKPSLRQGPYQWREDGLDRDLEMVLIGHCECLERERRIKDNVQFPSVDNRVDGGCAISFSSHCLATH